jgi:3-dehydroquinate synthase
MEKITINGISGSSTIIIGNAFDKVLEMCPRQNVFIITDYNVANFYKSIFPDFPVYEVAPGEKSKELHSLVPLFHWLLENGADRNSFILAIGGGVVCDLAGFIASTFMRGIKFGFVATSLLAQVDASVGGKNGVNLGGYKNIVGTFTQPEFVLCDSAMLKTLPEVEYTNGLAEIIKHALIRDAEKFAFLEANQKSIMSRENSSVDYLVSRSVHIKASIVQADEREHGERRLLNFGHTWGHAIEKVAQVPHGQAVSIGMVFAADFSVKLGLLTVEKRDRIVTLLKNYGLPVLSDYNKHEVFDAMLKDKKKQNNRMHYVLLEDIGKSLVKDIEIEELREFALHA